DVARFDRLTRDVLAARFLPGIVSQGVGDTPRRLQGLPGAVPVARVRLRVGEGHQGARLLLLVLDPVDRLQRPFQVSGFQLPDGDALQCMYLVVVDLQTRRTLQGAGDVTRLRLEDGDPGTGTTPGVVAGERRFFEPQRFLQAGSRGDLVAGFGLRQGDLFQ